MAMPKQMVSEYKLLRELDGAIEQVFPGLPINVVGFETTPKRQDDECSLVYLDWRPVYSTVVPSPYEGALNQECAKLRDRYDLVTASE